MKFSDLDFKPHPRSLGIQAKTFFQNGYGASVIKTPYSYGGDEDLYELAVLCKDGICYDSGLTEDVLGRGLRMIIENPWSEQTFLKANFVQAPTMVDKDRTLRGDYFKKPTAYWYINCDPTHGNSIQKDKPTRRICGLPPSEQAGLCGEERSLISPDYARNFICDFILGREQSEIDRQPVLPFVEENDA